MLEASFECFRWSKLKECGRLWNLARVKITFPSRSYSSVFWCSDLRLVLLLESGSGEGALQMQDWQCRKSKTTKFLVKGGRRRSFQTLRAAQTSGCSLREHAFRDPASLELLQTLLGFLKEFGFNRTTIDCGRIEKVCSPQAEFPEPYFVSANRSEMECSVQTIRHRFMPILALRKEGYLLGVLAVSLLGISIPCTSLKCSTSLSLRPNPASPFRRQPGSSHSYSGGLSGL